MFIRPAATGHRRPGRSPRRAAVLPWFVVTAPILLAVFVLAVHMASMRHRQLELQNATDAAALAGADDLVSDLLLTPNPHRHHAVIQQARTAALRYGALNLVNGKPLDIQPNEENYTDGDLVVGTLDAPNSHAFDAVFHREDNLFRPYLNAVRVSLRRSGVATSSTAYVDRDVIGFRLDGMQPLPVMPLAIFTDPCPPGQEKPEQWLTKDARSWEYQVLARQGRDSWTTPGADGKPQPGPDQVPEIDVVLSATGIDMKDNGCLTGIGSRSFAQALRQLTNGLTAEDLQARGGQLLLNDGLNSQQPDNRLMLPHLALSIHDMSALAKALQGLVGQRRICMLYDGQTTGSQKSVVIRGFVAARVMEVRTQTNTGTDGRKSPQVILVLQPCSYVTSTAVTDRTRRDLGPRSLYNPYLARVRLVE